MTDTKQHRRVRVAATIVGLLLLKAQVASIFFKVAGSYDVSWWLVFTPTLGLPVLIFVVFIGAALLGAALSMVKVRRDDPTRFPDHR